MDSQCPLERLIFLDNAFPQCQSPFDFPVVTGSQGRAKCILLLQQIPNFVLKGSIKSSPWGLQVYFFCHVPLCQILDIQTHKLGRQKFKGKAQECTQGVYLCVIHHTELKRMSCSGIFCVHICLGAPQIAVALGWHRGTACFP